MPGQELCLLALDGGGVRGLSSLIILEQLMRTINPISPPKPCEYFHMIGGTSTGGDLLDRVKIWEACRATSAASTFFDPIALGLYQEEFVDGATGANNPVWQLWDEAQLTWGPEPLESKIKCLVSIGTGIPSLKPFRDDILHTGETLVAIATETEATAEMFQRDKKHLDNTSRYYRFNVRSGLENIGLEESKKQKDIAAATRLYIGSQDVFKQMQACAGVMAGRECSAGDLDAVVKELMNWLAQPDNTEWLLIFDNVDDPDAYDLKRYFYGIDHGSVLITTRLATLEQLGDSHHLTKVNNNQSEAIFQNWYKYIYDPVQAERLFSKLGGLPLAIA
ncbi:hypothetical protein P7C71_g5419, partial [Lecanoromycetidae sp. Uapishka_2]